MAIHGRGSGQGIGKVLKAWAAHDPWGSMEALVIKNPISLGRHFRYASQVNASAVAAIQNGWFVQISRCLQRLPYLSTPHVC